MTQLRQGPAPVDLWCVAGDPCEWTLAIAGDPSSIADPEWTLLRSLGGSAVTGVSSSPSVAGLVATFGLTAAESAALKALGSAAAATTLVHSFALALDGASDTKEVIAGKLVVLPVGSSVPASASSTSLTVTIGDQSITVTVSLGGDPAAAVAAHTSDATGAHAASAISFSPTGTIAATDVQAAIAEAASETIQASVLTTSGDILTRGASAPDRITRASLAADTAFTSQYVTTINHGSTAGTARVGTAPCLWIGSVDPTNATNNDELYRTDRTALYVRVSGAWVEVGSTRFAPIGASVGELLASGETVMNRHGAFGPTASVATGNVYMTAFTARLTETVSQAVTQSWTAAGATPSTCKMGLYEIDSSGNASRLALTSNDTTLWASSFTRYTRSFTASATKTAGSRYALAVLVVTSASAPTLHGNQNLAGPDAADLPWSARYWTGQTDLPSSLTYASGTTWGSAFQGIVKP